MHLPPLHFDRAIPVFPLPNCVLFPGVVQPLHIFEPRYREMMERTLEDQSAIAMALLKPGWEKMYYGCPPIYEMVCVGRVMGHERLTDGKFNVLLQGITRARVLREERRGTAGVYRVGMLEIVGDVAGPAALCGHEILQRKVLRDLFVKSPLKDLTVAPTLTTLFEEEADRLPLSRLVDALAFALVQEVEAKQRLLEECDPLKRGEGLLKELVALAGRMGAQAAPPRVEWPPRMGMN